MKTELNIETEASQTIKSLNAIGTRDAKREGSALGDILGNYRKGRVGDCLLKSGITSAKDRFSL